MAKNVNMVTPIVDDTSPKELNQLKKTDKKANVGNLNLTQTEASQATLASPGVTEGTATTQDMGEKSDASYQMNKITSEESPMMRQARQEGMLAAAKRGLGNSSIASGSAQAAATKAATPLAQQNAAQEQKQELTNQAATNRFEELNTTEANKANLVDSTEQNKMTAQFDDIQAKADTTEYSTKAQATMQKFASDSELSRTWLSGEISTTLANIQGSHQQIIATSQFASSAYSSTMGAVADIMSNSEIPMKSKNSMANGLFKDLDGVLKVAGSITNMKFDFKV